MAAFGCFGNLFPSLASLPASSNIYPYCCFRTSTKPSFVSSLPSTALLNSSRSSGGIGRLGPFGALLGPVASDDFDTLTPVTATAGLSRMFWQLIGFNGIRGGSISVPFTCEDAFTGVVEALGFQYDVEYGSIGSCGFSRTVNLGNSTCKGGSYPLRCRA